MRQTQTIDWKPFSEKHKAYIKKALCCKMSVAEGSIRSGKTIDNCIIAAAYLERCKDKIHLASGSTIGNAKLNIGACNGYRLENLFGDGVSGANIKAMSVCIFSPRQGKRY